MSPGPGGMRLRRLSGLSRYSRHQQLREFLRPGSGAASREESQPRARLRCCSRRRLFLHLPRDNRLLSFEPSPARGPAPRPLDRSFPGPEQLLDVLELERPGPGSGESGSSTAALITQRGRTELWNYREAVGWQLLQAAELCSSPQARLLSAAWDGHSISWCEERPQPSAPLQHCICSRSLGPGLTLGPVRTLMHNSPAYRLYAAGEAVYLLPSIRPYPSNCPIPSNNPSNCPFPSNSSIHSNNPSNCPIPSNSSIHSNNPSNCPSPSNCHIPTNCSMHNLVKFILIWSPQEDTLTVTCLARGPLSTRRLLYEDSDFTRLVADVAGILPSLPLLEIRAVSPCPTGLLVAESSGEVSLIQNDGTVRLLCHLSQSPAAEGSMMMELCGTTLACTLGRTLQHFDTETGRLVEEATLEVQPLALIPYWETGEIQLLVEDGIYSLGIHPGNSNIKLGFCSGSSQVQEMLEQLVLEEACKYYQKRSLSRSRLTVQKLKSEAMFQAPLTLCSILQNEFYLRKTGHYNQQTYIKLHNIMAGEIQSYVNLEEAKSCLVNGSEIEVAAYVEEITEQEIQRLLHCQLDREALVYLNSIFNTFPREAWKAVKRTLHLHQNSEGSFSARATADLWRVILSPGLPPDQSPTANGAVPVFELICRLLYQFHPKWLPMFIELTQQHLATFRNYGNSESLENIPLYKRALSVIPSACTGGAGDPTETIIELLLCSKRPNAIIQAVRLLIERGMWQRAVQATSRFSQQGPLLKKELFAAMLVQVSQHRALDPYLEEIWELCPEDTTAADILDVVLGSVPSSCESRPYSSDGNQLTVGLLRPLLTKVLTQGEDRQWMGMAEGPKTLVFPPPTPPRQKKAADQPNPLNIEPSMEANKML
ncbi:Hermansky-Pudlak syndrome 6 protein homolog [Rhincodon typus]|uniref:Hermansky-Pudlak syndrome 6 protein homolog n=1 Tax=Rhincodon typus TaxID=259920 RepID=UPI0020306EA7|nr:Hermansky-Pudlak syndrome 6 protein homolog [Rhincodon typus]